MEFQHKILVMDALKIVKLGKKELMAIVSSNNLCFCVVFVFKRCYEGLYIISNFILGFYEDNLSEPTMIINDDEEILWL